jgi:hypothetical protein
MAMKLVAMQRQDLRDIVALARAPGGNATLGRPPHRQRASLHVPAASRGKKLCGKVADQLRSLAGEGGHGQRGGDIDVIARLLSGPKAAHHVAIVLCRPRGYQGPRFVAPAGRPPQNVPQSGRSTHTAKYRLTMEP